MSHGNASDAMKQTMAQNKNLLGKRKNYLKENNGLCGDNPDIYAPVNKEVDPDKLARFRERMYQQKKKDRKRHFIFIVSLVTTILVVGYWILFKI